MSRKRVRLYSIIITILLGISLLAIGIREILLPDSTPAYIERIRLGVLHGDYSQVQRLGMYVLASGILLLVFCWYLRVRNFWFVVSLAILFYGAMYYVSPEQSLDMLKRIYLGDPFNQRVAAGIKIVTGAALMASIRWSE